MKPTQEQVIAWAREAGLQYYEEHRVPVVSLGNIAVTDLVRFATLAYEAGRKDENEACAEIIGTHRIPFGNSAAGEMACDLTYNAMREVYDAIRARRQR